jgi:hypothetical protein
MSKKILITLSVVTILLIIFAGIIYWYFSSSNFKNIEIVNPVIEQNNSQVSNIPTVEEMVDKVNDEYPETVSGIINFSGAGASFKATLKTDAGKIYILWPIEPKSVYESFGVKDGVKIEVRAKSLESENLEWKLMKAI